MAYGCIAMPKPFGEWLDEKIKDAGTNPNKLAKAIKKSPAHIYRIIGGSVNASPEVLRDLADALGMRQSVVFIAWSESESGEEIVYSPHPDLAPLIEGYEGLDDASAQEQLRETWEADLAAAGRLVSRKKGIIGRGEKADEGTYGRSQMNADEKRVQIATTADFADDAD